MEALPSGSSHPFPLPRSPESPPLQPPQDPGRARPRDRAVPEGRGLIPPLQMPHLRLRAAQGRSALSSLGWTEALDPCVLRGAEPRSQGCSLRVRPAPAVRYPAPPRADPRG